MSGNYSRYLRRTTKKKLEFGQKMILAVMFFVMGCTAVSYILCFLGLASNEILTTAFWSQGGVVLLMLGYFAYQWGLKNSRNKYFIDVSGNPILDNDGNPIMRK